MFTYIKWLLIFVWLPTLILWIVNFNFLKQYKRTLLFCVFFALVFSVPWDFWAIKTKIWFFPQDRTLGVWFGGLPLEEYLFIIFVTFGVSTVTLILKHKSKNLITNNKK